VLITASLMLGTYTIVDPAANAGWGAAETLALGAGAAGLLVAFLVREATAANPLVPLRILRARPVAAANTIQILSVAGMFGMFFLGALYLRRVLGYDALGIGLAFLPVCVAMGVLSIRYSERMVMRFGARATLVAGLLLVMVGLAWFARAPVHAGYAVDVMPAMLLLGVGAGTAFPALMNVAMSGATPADAGLASGLVNTTAQVGGALGLAVLATLATSHTHQLEQGGRSTLSALTGGYHVAFWIAAALVAGAIGVTAALPKAGRAHAAAAASGERGLHGQPRPSGRAELGREAA
jgi:predicted MFS family arabinose efflux permease